jgi:Protein of unknown function (DUF1236)
MKRLQLLSSVAATVLLVAGIAAAQDNPVQPQRAPTAQRHAPAEKIAPSMHAGSHARGAAGAETTGQAVEQPKAAKHGKAQTTGQGIEQPKAAEHGKAEMKGKAEMNANPKLKTESRSSGSSKSSESTSQRSTNGQGAAAGTAKLSSTQRTKITAIIKKQHVQPAHINVAVRVGVRVPERVHFYPVPVEVVAIYPEWRGYDYILVGDQIVIIDPDSHLVVAILVA